MWGRQRFGTLNTGELLGGWALAFDWLCPEMDSAHVASSVQALTDLCDGMERSGSMDPIAGRLDNNHIGVAYGGRGLAALAQEGHLSGAAEDARRARLETAADLVSSFLDLAYPGGAGYEGAMYAIYGMNVSLPFALATERLRGHIGLVSAGRP